MASLVDSLLALGFTADEVKALEYVCRYSTSDTLEWVMFDGQYHPARVCRNRDIDKSKMPFDNPRTLSGLLSSVKKKASKSKSPLLGYWKSTTKESGMPWWAAEEWGFNIEFFKEWVE